MLVPCGAVQSRLSTVGAIVHLVSRSRRPRLDDDQAERLASSRTAQACCYARPGAIRLLVASATLTSERFHQSSRTSRATAISGQRIKHRYTALWVTESYSCRPLWGSVRIGRPATALVVRLAWSSGGTAQQEPASHSVR